MTFKDELSAQRRSARNAAFVLFVTRYKPKSNIHYVFCESPDDAQFYERVLNLAFDEVRFDFIPCNGKKLVLHTRQLVSSETYVKERISYIIDRDHDGFIKGALSKEKDTFVTDFYSVESYLCCISILVESLRQFCGLHKDDPALKEAEKTGNILFDQFVKAMVDPMAMTIVLRRVGGPESIHLDEIGLHDFIKFVHGPGIEIKGSLAEQILAHWKGAPNGSEGKKAARLARTLIKQDPRVWIRGKFLSWWWSRSFNELSKHLSKKCPDMNGKPIKCSLQMGDGHFIPVTKMHANCPKRLKRFFSRRLEEIRGAVA